MLPLYKMALLVRSSVQKPAKPQNDPETAGKDFDRNKDRKGKQFHIMCHGSFYFSGNAHKKSREKPRPSNETHNSLLGPAELDDSGQGNMVVIKFIYGEPIKVQCNLEPFCIVTDMRLIIE